MDLLYSKLFRYKWLSGAVLFLMLFDMLCNTTFLIFSHHTLITLLIYIMQNVSKVFSFIMIAFGIFSTTLAQRGFVGEALNRFKSVIMVGVCYLILGLFFHWMFLDQRWGAPEKYVWTDGMVTLFTFERLVSVIYYYLVKRTMLLLSDGSLYVGKTENVERREES